MLLIIFRLALRNIFRNPRRSFLTFLALTAGMWSVLALAGLARGVSAQMADNAINNLTGHIQIHAKGYIDDPVVAHSMPSPHGALRALMGGSSVRGYAERVRVPAMVSSERESYGVTIVGIDPAQEKDISFISDVPLRGVRLESPEDSGILIGKKLADLLQTDIGKRIVVSGQDKSNKIADRGFKIMGIFDAKLESTERAFVFVGRRAAQDLFGMGSNISEVAITLAERERASSAAATMQEVAGDLEAIPWTRLEPFVTTLMKVQDGFLRFWFLIVIVAVMFGLLNALFMGIFERVREIGLMQAMGMRPALIVAEVLLGSIMLIFAGALVGNVMGYATIYYLRNGIDISRFSRGAGMAGIGDAIVPVLRVDDQIMANAFIFVLGVLFSLYPAWRASRYSPVEALR